jgi:hypothetical protein
LKALSVAVWRRYRAKREASLSRSPGYLHKEIVSLRLGELCYALHTVQPGTAMTVKEMGPASATRRAFFDLL